MLHFSPTIRQLIPNATVNLKCYAPIKSKKDSENNGQVNEAVRTTSCSGYEKTDGQSGQKSRRRVHVLERGRVKEVLSTAVDFIPVVGNVKSAYEAIVGRNPITGRKLEDWERVVAAAGILVGPAAKVVKHAGKLVVGATKVRKPAIVNTIEELTNALAHVKTSQPFAKLDGQLAVVSGVGRGTRTNTFGKSVADKMDGKKSSNVWTKQEKPSSSNKQTKATQTTTTKANQQTKGTSKPNGGTGNNHTKVNYGEQYTKDGRRKVLKSNVEYTTPAGHTYRTDDKGRIVSAEAKLNLGEGKRNNHAQKVAGREDRLPDDEGGHLVASIFKGSGSLDNLVPMNGNLNKGEWKKLESMWAKALDKGKSVEVKINPKYEGNSQRPASFEIEYKIGKGDWEFKEFKNKPGGK